MPLCATILATVMRNPMEACSFFHTSAVWALLETVVQTLVMRKDKTLSKGTHRPTLLY